MQYALIENNIVKKIIATNEQRSAPWVKLPSSHEAIVGDSINKFENDWTLRPASKLIEEGLIELEKEPVGSEEIPLGTVLQKIENGEIVEKTYYDFVMEGIKQLEGGEVLDHESKEVRPGTLDELLEQGRIDKDTYVHRKAEKIRDMRSSYITKTDWVFLPDVSISKEKLEAVKSYRQALRDVPQQEGFPYEVEWPEEP